MFSLEATTNIAPTTLDVVEVKARSHALRRCTARLPTYTEHMSRRDRHALASQYSHQVYSQARSRSISAVLH